MFEKWTQIHLQSPILRAILGNTWYFFKIKYNNSRSPKMGQQLNKIEKRNRRKAYLERVHERNMAAKAAAAKKK